MSADQHMKFGHEIPCDLCGVPAGQCCTAACGECRREVIA